MLLDQRSGGRFISQRYHCRPCGWAIFAESFVQPRNIISVLEVVQATPQAQLRPAHSIGTCLAKSVDMLAARSLNPDCNDEIQLSVESPKPVPKVMLDTSTLELLDKLTDAVWLIDPHEDRIQWTNRVGSTLFGHSSRDALLSEAVSASQLLAIALKQLPIQIKPTVPIRHVRTIKLNGQEKRVEVSLSRWDRAPDPSWIFVGIRPTLPAESEVQLADRLLSSAPCISAVFSVHERLLQANQMAQKTFGSVFSLRSMFAHRSDYADLTEQLARYGKFKRDAILYTTRGKRWFAIDAENTIFGKNNEEVLLFYAIDITARIQAEQAKDELVSMVSHELRTPMTAIRGAVELLAGGMAEHDPTLFHELLGIASENTKRLQKLVDTLLDLRKLANGRISIAVAPCDLAQVLHSAIDLQTPDAEAKGIVIVASGDNSLPISGDEGRMQQVLLNLLSNAIKHSPLGGEIQIRATTDLDEVRISIADDGPGIPTPFQDRIFEPFSQADSSSTRQDSGMGLGLYMTKTLVELHGGRLSFTNRSEGGSTFTMELPRHRSLGA